MMEDFVMSIYKTLSRSIMRWLLYFLIAAVVFWAAFGDETLQHIEAMKGVRSANQREIRHEIQ